MPKVEDEKPVNLSVAVKLSSLLPPDLDRQLRKIVSGELTDREEMQRVIDAAVRQNLEVTQLQWKDDLLIARAKQALYQHPSFNGLT